MKIAVIGGGPIGMEAALYGACAGFDVRLYERGRLGENVRQWGHVSVFTDWRRNRSPLAARLLTERGATLPSPDTNSTGDELADYVVRLAGLEPLRGRIAPQTEVLSIAREACLKSDFIDDARRLERPFRLLVRAGRLEKIIPADAVIDATGVYATPNWIGNGGMPSVGEMGLRARIDYALPDVLGRERARFAGRHTLIVGSGHSAASTLRDIGALIEEFPATRMTWVVRRDVPPHGFPYSIVPNDSSPHREELHRRANELSRDLHVDFCPRHVVDALSFDGQKWRVALDSGGQKRDIECDNVVAHTGFRPDETLWQELSVRVHSATQGPLVLAQALVNQNHRGGVGLSTGYAERPAKKSAENASQSTLESSEAAPVDRWKFSPDDPALLETGEANFFVIGIKSYGRDAGFLMHNGFRQVRDVYKLLSHNLDLDLYQGELDVKAPETAAVKTEA